MTDRHRPHLPAPHAREGTTTMTMTMTNPQPTAEEAAGTCPEQAIVVTQ